MSVTEISSIDENANFLANHPSTIIFFGSARCGHCVAATPYFKDLATKYPRIAFGHIEVNKVKVNGLQGVPTFVAYQSGQPIDSVVGANRPAIERMLSKLDQSNTDPFLGPKSATKY